MKIDTSRKPQNLHPQLQEAWKYLRDKWHSENPNGPKVELSCTYRGPIDQQAAYNTGASKVKFGNSLHNYKPAFAFDIYFYRGNSADWSFKWFEKFAVNAEEIGLEWGGRWAGLIDGPHFQFKDATPEDAKMGFVRNHLVIPKLASESKPDALGVSEKNNDWKLVVLSDKNVQHIIDIAPGADVVTRVSPWNNRVYVDVRIY